MTRHPDLPPTSPAAAELPTAGRVMIVDADQAVTEPLAYLLLQAGFAVVVVSSGPAALAEFADRGADMVLLDLEPGDDGMSGLATCERLRTASAVPIIVLTDSDLEADKVAALELGADDYVTKPFGTRELRARVKALLRRARSEAGRSGDLPVRKR